MASPDLKLRLLVLGVIVYAVGYLGLLLTVLQGDLGGAVGLVAMVMATGVLIAGVFGVLLAKYTMDVLGEL